MRIAAWPAVALATNPHLGHLVHICAPQPDQKIEVDYGTGEAVARDSSSSSSSSSSSNSKVLVCTDSVAARGGLQPTDLLVKAASAAAGGGSSTALADIAVSGLPGWVAVWAPKANRDVRCGAREERGGGGGGGVG